MKASRPCAGSTIATLTAERDAPWARTTRCTVTRPDDPHSPIKVHGVTPTEVLRVGRLIALARGMFAVGLITAAERDALIALALEAE